MNNTFVSFADELLRIKGDFRLALRPQPDKTITIDLKPPYSMKHYGDYIEVCLRDVVLEELLRGAQYVTLNDFFNNHPLELGAMGIRSGLLTDHHDLRIILRQCP